ncbi:MAG: methylated-DNA--[protein]-cysteine S-methyltransferase [Acidimicrobiales bacterium]
MSHTHEEIGARLRAAAATLGGAFDRAGFAARAGDEGLVDVAWCRVDSPVGPLVVAGTEAGLLAVSFDDPDAALAPIAEHVSPRILEMPDRLDPVRRQLDEYFAGARHRFALALDRRLSRGFRATVLRALEAVEYGQTVSYAELAARAGNPQAFRAVGSAMATNPIPIVVPCHRVLRTGGGLGGYAGGLEVKRWLLDLEGAATPTG